MFDFHTHTFLSDGVLSPIELIRRALVRGYQAIGVTDHVGVGNLESVVKTLVRDCEEATKRWDILAIPGVEITHVPKDDIDQVALAAKQLGARLVTVHGETIVEPVEPGTNEAALRSSAVDVLAHPGLILLEEARLAAETGVFLEVSARKGHSFANGHVVEMARQAGATMVLDSDAHEPDDLLTPELSHKIALGAGLTEEEAHALLELNPRSLLARLGFEAVPTSIGSGMTAL
jgi:putative hydrolase